MTFGEVLEDTARSVEGLVAVGLVGLDGIGVEMLLADGVEGVDHEEVEVELAGMVSSLNRSLNAMSAGKTRELILEADNLCYLLSMVDPNYFLAFIMSAGTNLGRARFEMRRTAQRIRETF